MIRDEELEAFIRQLAAEGIHAFEAGEPAPGKGTQIGVTIANLGFFPLWELNEPENEGLVAARDFAAIKAKRPAKWEMVERRLWDKSAAQGE